MPEVCISMFLRKSEILDMPQKSPYEVDNLAYIRSLGRIVAKNRKVASGQAIECTGYAVWVSIFRRFPPKSANNSASNRQA
jgi:hypothetical protein